MYKIKIKTPKLFLDFLTDKDVIINGVGNNVPFHNDKEYLRGFKYIADRIATRNAKIQLIDVEVNGYKVELQYIDFKENIFYLSLMNPQGHNDGDVFVVLNKYFLDFEKLTAEEIASTHEKHNIYNF